MNTASAKPGVTAASSVFELEHFLPYRLSLLTNTVSDGIARSYRDKYEISVTQWRILAVLGRYPGLTASEIVERTAMDKVAISRAVKNLVDKSLLQRKTDPVDRRRMRLYSTPGRGKRMLSEIIPLARQYEARLLNALSNEEQQAISRAIQKLQIQARSLNTR